MRFEGRVRQAWLASKAGDLLTPREVADLEPDLDLSASDSSTVLFAPDGAGRLLLHDNAADAGLQPGAVPSPAMPEAGAMVAAATRLFPAIAGIAAEAARIVTRPVPGDGYSAVGWVPGIEGYDLAVTHSAVTLSAHLGAVIAAEVGGGTGDGALLPFRPARFFGGNAGPLGAAEALTHAG